MGKPVAGLIKKLRRKIWNSRYEKDVNIDKEEAG